MYGIDELSDTDGEGDLPENPMSPEQIALMRKPLLARSYARACCPDARVPRALDRPAVDRQIALTRELDLEGDPTKRAPPHAPASSS